MIFTDRQHWQAGETKEKVEGRLPLHLNSGSPLSRLCRMFSFSTTGKQKFGPAGVYICKESQADMEAEDSPSPLPSIPLGGLKFPWTALLEWKVWWAQHPLKTPDDKIRGKAATQRPWKQHPSIAAVPPDSGHIATVPFSTFSSLLFQ